MSGVQLSEPVRHDSATIRTFDRIDKAAEELDQLHQNLRAKIAPMLREATPTCGPPADPGESFNSDFFTELNSKISRFESLLGELNNTIDRIEI